MRKRLAGATFSLNSLSFAVGALGFLAAFVQIFIDTTVDVSVRWLLLVIWLSLTFMLVLLKLIHDLHQEKRPASPFEVPIRYLAEQEIFLIRKNENFVNSIVVACYFQNDEVDTLACIGFVHIVQEKVIQIKVQGQFVGGFLPPTSPEVLARLVVRPVVPIDALTQFSSAGS